MMNNIRQHFKELDCVLEELEHYIKEDMKNETIDPLYIRDQIFKRRMRLHGMEMKVWKKK